MSLPLHILTIVLDGMPFLPMQLSTFNRLRCDWKWSIVEGAAANTGSTKWCRVQEPRLSKDGSTQFINSLRNHPRVTVYQQQWWPGGKDEMVNAPLLDTKEPCWILEVDVDELWLAAQIDKMMDLFSGPMGNNYNCARFHCRYFVGPNIITVGDNCYGSNPGEWLRLFKFYPGCKFLSHEPPVMQGVNDTGETPDGRGTIENERCVSRESTRRFGLDFEHWAYVFPQQVMFKEQFYGYKNALAQWMRLQRNTVFPTKLKQWLSWADDRAMADLLYK